MHKWLRVRRLEILHQTNHAVVVSCTCSKSPPPIHPCIPLQSSSLVRNESSDSPKIQKIGGKSRLFWVPEILKKIPRKRLYSVWYMFWKNNKTGWLQRVPDEQCPAAPAGEKKNKKKQKKKRKKSVYFWHVKLQESESNVPRSLSDKGKVQQQKTKMWL